MASFLKLAGITGGSTTKGYAGQIDVSSYSFGIQVPLATGSTGSGAGKPSLSSLSFAKALDTSTVPILSTLLTGRRVTTAVLTVTTDGVTNVVETITFTNVEFGSYQQSDDSTGTPAESISFDFSEVTYKVGAQQFTYNVANNTAG